MSSSSGPTPRPSTQSPEPTHSTIHFVTQDDCFKHVYRRSKDVSTIFERPERLRFVNLGLAAAVAWDWVHRLNGTAPPASLTPPVVVQPEPNSLSSLIRSSQVTFSKSSRKISPNDPAFDKVHDQPNQSPIPPSPSTSDAVPSNSKDPSNATNNPKFADFQQSTNYLDQLIGLCRRASELYHLGLSEVPEHLPQGDLYLSQGSEAAILGAIGACYAAVDSILKVEDVKPEPTTSPSSTTQNEIQASQYKKAFVNIRPPGHHCTDSEPMGFCWVNNVLIGCMYSYLTYGIDRICIVDIDLHHGNGNQQIVWSLNAQAGSEISEKSARSTPGRRPLQISYSSLHDINSYPCEDGDPDRIKEASLNICVGNSINQFIQNLHIQDWRDEQDFYLRLYPETWAAFEKHMLNFFQITDASPDRSLIFVSAGFDACEYETGQMSRFAKKLPASFFNRFAADISRFSDSHCNGRLISVLEGGYSEQTLTGSSLSYMLGLMDNSRTYSEENSPWSLTRINQLLKLCKKGDPNRKTSSMNKTTEISLEDSKDTRWISETRRLFEHIDSFEEVKSELNKSNKLEEKQVKLQHALSQLEVHSPEGLRRSQRHTSSTKKSDSSPSKATSNTPPSKAATPLPTKLTQVPLQPTQTLPLASGPTSNTCLDKSSQVDLQAPQETNSEHASPAPQTKNISPPPDQHQNRSIDEMLGNLKIVETHSSSESSSPPPNEKDNNDLGSLNHNPSTNTNNNTNKLPKVKLVWKAGGLFGS